MAAQACFSNIPRPTLPSLPSFDPVRSRCGRFTSNWQMIPAVLALVGSVIALGAAILWNNHWLTVATGISTIGSLHGIYQTRRAKDLGSLKENIRKAEVQLAQNQQVTEANRELNAKAQQLQAQLDSIKRQFENGNDAYKELNGQHAALVEGLQAIEQSLGQSGGALTGVAERFERIATAMDVEGTRLRLEALQRETAALAAATQVIQAASGEVRFAAADARAAADTSRAAAAAFSPPGTPSKKGGNKNRQKND